MGESPGGVSPRIVITVAVAARQAAPELAERKNALYADAVRRHGGEAVMLDAASSGAERRLALRQMDGLLLAGGADIDPARYGSPMAGAQAVESDRDDLEAEAWAAAGERDLPLLGICRGFQAINVFSGGRLLQDVEGHRGRGWREGPALQHPIRVIPGTRLARILFPTNVGGGVLHVNSFHHQAVDAAGLAPGLLANATARWPAGELVEGVEAAGSRFLIGVQCHPERLESTPPAFDRLWRVFVDACRGPTRR